MKKKFTKQQIDDVLFYEGRFCGSGGNADNTGLSIEDVKQILSKYA